MNKIQKKNTHTHTHTHEHLRHHRVINSSTGAVAVVEDDGIRFELTIGMGIFVEFVDEEVDEDTGMVNGGSGKRTLRES